MKRFLSRQWARTDLLTLGGAVFHALFWAFSGFILGAGWGFGNGYLDGFVAAVTEVWLVR